MIFILLMMFCSVRKILNVRLFEGGEGKKWECGVKDAALEILCVSQVSCFLNKKNNLYLGFAFQ